MQLLLVLLLEVVAGYKRLCAVHAAGRAGRGRASEPQHRLTVLVCDSASNPLGRMQFETAEQPLHETLDSLKQVDGDRSRVPVLPIGELLP
jgi:hypothetical protein